MRDIFTYTDYRSLIRDFIEMQKRKGSRLNYSKLAAAIKVQKSYLSQVMAGQSDLNSDQLFRLGKTMLLKPEQYEYVQTLLEAERTRISERRYALKMRLQEIRRRAGALVDEVVAMSKHR